MFVLIDDLAPLQGAFSQALDLAKRLHLPLCGIPISGWRNRLEKLGVEQACADTCKKLGVCWEQCSGQNGNRSETTLDLGPRGLLVLGQRIPGVLRKDLLEAQQKNSGAVLVCPDVCPAASRILILDQGVNSGGDFLRASAELCHSLQTAVVVLTVARSEKEAQLRQCAAREALAGRCPKADFDFIIGSEIEVAAVSVARWRRCQFLIMERQTTAPWRRWFRRDSMERLVEPRGNLSFLTLAPGIAPDVPLECGKGALASR